MFGGGEFEVFLQVRLEAEGTPNANDGVLIETARLGHGASTPVRGVLRTGFQGAGDDGLDLGVRQLSGSVGALKSVPNMVATMKNTVLVLKNGLQSQVIGG
jgi:hypothetical protein